MSTHEAAAEEVGSLEYVIGAGIGAGFLGGLAMGVILHTGADLMTFIGALYGAPTVPAGWITHLVNSVIIGLLFALTVSRAAIDVRINTALEYAIAGMVYATGVGLVVVGVMLPISMRLVGTAALPEPPIPLPGLLGEFVVVVSVAVAHLAYGLVLGATYYAIESAVGGPTPGSTERGP